MLDEWGKGFIVGVALASVFFWILFSRIENYQVNNMSEGNDVREYIPKSDKYYLQSYRYLELKAYCRQYQSWKQGLAQCYGFKANSFDSSPIRGSEHSDPTERAVELADETLAPYVLLNVTQGLSFDRMTAQGRRPPCGINQFYEARQKFFWELDQLKG